MKRIFFIALFFVSLAGYSQMKNNNAPIINILNYGARGDAITFDDGVVNGSTTFTSASATFTSSDVGKLITIWGVGAASADLVTTIATFTNSHSIVLTAAATASGSAKTFYYGTDNTTALQAAATATVSTGSQVVAPMGKYLNQGGINFPNPVTIIGQASAKREGTWDSTHLSGNGPFPQTAFWSVRANQDMIRLQGHGSFMQFIDFAIVTSTTLTSGACVKANGSQTSAENCVFLGGYYGFRQTNSVGWHASHCLFEGATFAGLYINNTNAPDNGDYNITGCLFQSGFISGTYGIRIESSGGARIVNNKFNTGLTTPISIAISTTLNNTSDLIVLGNSLENFTSRGVEILLTNSALFYNIDISDNQFYSATTTAKAIYLSGGITSGISGGTITANDFRFTSSTDTCVYLKNVTSVTVGLNEMYVGNLGIYVDATCTAVHEMSSVASASGTMSFKNGTNPMLFTASYLDIPKLQWAATSSGTFGMYNAAFGNTGFSDIIMAPQGGVAGQTSRIFLSPKGTGAAGTDLADILLSNKDFVADGTNVEFLKLQTAATQYNIFSVAAGTGTVRPIYLYTGANTSQVILNIDGTTSFGSHIKPVTTASYDLGTSSLIWRDVYLSHPVGKSTIGVSSGLGTNVTSVTPAGSDAYFNLTVVTSANASGTIGLVAFGRTWGATPYCVVSAANAATGAMIASAGGYVALNATSTSSMTLAGVFTGAGTWVFNCHCGQ